MMRLLWLPPLLPFLSAATNLAGVVVATTGDAQNPMNTADGYLRSSSKRIGDAAASVLGIQSSLDDMKQDLSVEYDRWKQKQGGILADRSHIKAEKARLEQVLLEQQSLSEEKLRLTGELALHKAEAERAALARTAAAERWTPQNSSLRSDIDLLEEQVGSSGVIRLKHEETATAHTSEIQARNGALQADIFKLNQDVFKLKDSLSNITIDANQEHSSLLSEVAVVQKQIHALQDDVVARAQTQLEVERHWKRLTAQANEVVEQKEHLHEAQLSCENELARFDADITAAQNSLKASDARMRECQATDAETQRIQGDLNECRQLLRR